MARARRAVSRALVSRARDGKSLGAPRRAREVGASARYARNRAPRGPGGGRGATVRVDGKKRASGSGRDTVERARARRERAPPRAGGRGTYRRESIVRIQKTRGAPDVRARLCLRGARRRSAATARARSKTSATAGGRLFLPARYQRSVADDRWRRDTRNSKFKISRATQPPARPGRVLVFRPLVARLPPRQTRRPRRVRRGVRRGRDGVDDAPITTSSVASRWRRWCGSESATRPACGPSSRVQKRMPVAPAFTPRRRYPGRRILGRPPRARAWWRVPRGTASMRFTRTAL
jgi:hypothetical protein